MKVFVHHLSTHTRRIIASKRMIDFAVATAVARYNAGYIEASLCEKLGVQMSQGVLKYLEKQDKKMDTPSRRKMRKRVLRRELEYAAGAF